MDEHIRYQKDQATVIAIIKYTMYLMIAAVVLYFSTKVIVMIFPFLIGFVLAKASRHIAKSILQLQNYICRIVKRNRSKSNAGISSSDCNDYESVPVRKTKKRSKIYTLFFSQKQRRVLSRRSKVSLVIYVLMLILLFAAIITSTSALVIQVNKVIANFPLWITQSDYVGLVTNWISQFSTEQGGFLSPNQLVAITEYITNIKTSIIDMLPTLVTNVLSGIISVLGDLPMLLFIFIVIIMSGFYFLTDTKMVFEFLSRNIKSRSFRHKSIQLVDRLSTTLFRVLGGYLLLLIVTFTESLLIFWIVGINYSFVLALITAVLDFMPVLGVSATMVPMIIYFASQGNYTGIVILLIGMAIITVVRRVIEPAILGNAMHMHPLATLFAMIFGVAVWGAIGFLMGPVVFLILKEAFIGFSLDKKFRDVLGNILNKFTQ